MSQTCARCCVSKPLADYSLVTRGPTEGKLGKICVKCQQAKSKQKETMLGLQDNDLPHLNGILETLDALKAESSFEKKIQIRVSDMVRDLVSDPAVEDHSEGASMEQPGDALGTENGHCPPRDICRRCADVIARRIWEILEYRFM